MSCLPFLLLLDLIVNMLYPAVPSSLNSLSSSLLPDYRNVGAVHASGFLAVTLALELQSPFERAQSFIRHMHDSDIFNATEQHVSTTGEHRFIPPSSTDLRGPCPFLNAAANHDYIDKSGYTTTYEVVAATVDIFGLGKDLATFLAVHAAVTQGEVTSFSIGGAPASLQAARFPGQFVLGAGLSSDNLEEDVSPLTANIYMTTSSSSRVAHFEHLSSMNEPLIPRLADFRATRNRDGIAKNKSYFYGPFTALIMQPMTYSFMYRLFANHSADHPVGYFPQGVLKSFYAIQTINGKLTYVPGHERIPEGFFRRSKKIPYDNTFFLNDALCQASLDPEFFRLGGNVDGKVNNFRPIDIKELTRGAFRAATLHQYFNFA